VKADIDTTVVYPHPIERVWAALTSSAALAAWLMPNDFEPEIGREFTFTTKRAPGFDGIVHCRVVEMEPPTRMVWTWAGGNIDTIVTFTLDPVDADHTRLRMRQVGFHGLGPLLTRRILASGYSRMFGELLPGYLDQQAGRDADPERASGRRACPGVFRRRRRTANR
jgi:uncharacterized protein YndB with AHSA1/START domain